VSGMKWAAQKTAVPQGLVFGSPGLLLLVLFFFARAVWSFSILIGEETGVAEGQTPSFPLQTKKSDVTSDVTKSIVPLQAYDAGRS
jgi:hypothetical protein